MEATSEKYVEPLVFMKAWQSGLKFAEIARRQDLRNWPENGK